MNKKFINCKSVIKVNKFKFYNISNNIILYYYYINAS